MYCGVYFRNPCGGHDGNLIEVFGGKVFNRPVTCCCFGGAINPVGIERRGNKSLLVVIEWCVANIGLGAGVEYLAVAVNFNVLDPARNDLALPVDLATISYGVIKVHKKPWFGR